MNGLFSARSSVTASSTLADRGAQPRTVLADHRGVGRRRVLCFETGEPQR
jgi:hypothetical protein